MPFLSTSYDAAFDGVDFWELTESGWYVEPDTGVEYSVTHIPGGSTTVVQSAGQATTTLDLPIGVEAADLADLQSKARSARRGELEYHAGTQMVRLMKVKNVRRAGPYSDGYTAVLEFVVG